MVQELIFSVIGGLGLFIYGIHLMGEGLQNAAGDRLRRLLKALTKNTFSGRFGWKYYFCFGKVTEFYRIFR